jgi:hypothetical protein
MATPNGTNPGIKPANSFPESISGISIPLQSAGLMGDQPDSGQEAIYWVRELFREKGTAG